MKTPAALALLIGIGAVAPGEPSPSRSAAFAEVSREVEQRLGLAPHWQAADTAPDVTERVDALLSGELTAEGAIQVALLRQPELQAAFEELGVSRADLLQAGLVRNPVIEAEFRFLTGGPEHTAELNLVQDVIDLAFRSSRRRIARAFLRAAQARAVAAAIDTAAAAREGWYRAVAAGQVLDLRRTVLEAVGASYEVARRLHAAGNLNDLDLSQEQSLYEQARLDVTAAEAEAEATREDLAAALGLWGPTLWFSLPPRLPDLPDEDPDLTLLEVRALEASLDLAAARHEREASGREAALARSMGRIPRLGLGVSAEREDSGHWGLGPAVVLGLPLFDRGQGRVEAARARTRQADSLQVALGTRIRAMVRGGGARLAGAHQRAEHLKSVVLPLWARIVEQAQLRYNAMALGVFQLLAAKRSQVDVGRQYVEALRDYWVTRVSIDALGQGRARRATSTPGPSDGARSSTGEAGDH